MAPDDRAAHVLASAAILIAFPAVEVQSPADYAGWYVDGGCDSTPLRPAVALGADHLVVIAAHATRYPARTTCQATNRTWRIRQP